MLRSRPATHPMRGSSHPSDRVGHVLLVTEDATLLTEVLRAGAAHSGRVQRVGTLEQLPAALPLPRPACLLTDAAVEALQGVLLQDALKSRGQRLPVVALIDRGHVQAARAAFRAGAFDVVEREALSEQLPAVLQAAIEHDERHLNDRDSAQAAYGRLSQRERDVFWLVTNGQTSREIAVVLGLSPRTVEAFRARLMLRLGARNLADLLRVRFALEPHAFSATAASATPPPDTPRENR